MAKVLSAVDTSLDACRKEMKNDESSLPAEGFSRVLAVCVKALRNLLAKPAGRALAAEGKARRAAARLELHLPAALADLAAVCQGVPELDEVRKAYHEVVGTDEKAIIAARASLVDKKKKKTGRLRSRNVVIDSWLEDEGDEDDFADLEDFVCGMDEKDL